MLKERGIIIHPQECGDYFASRLEETHLNVLGVHPEGGTAAHASMENCIHMLEDIFGLNRQSFHTAP